jgi:hypothetical protein
MNIEQEKDLILQELKNQILRDKAPAAINNKHILIENAGGTGVSCMGALTFFKFRV